MNHKFQPGDRVRLVARPERLGIFVRYAHRFNSEKLSNTVVIKWDDSSYLQYEHVTYVMLDKWMAPDPGDLHTGFTALFDMVIDGFDDGHVLDEKIEVTVKNALIWESDPTAPDYKRIVDEVGRILEAHTQWSSRTTDEIAATFHVFGLVDDGYEFKYRGR